MYYNLQKLTNAFDKIALTRSAGAAFEEILDHALLPFQYFDTGKELSEAAVKMRSYDKAEALKEFLLELATLNPEGFADPLGELYMQSVSHGRHGQFFTPETIAAFQALAITQNPEELKGKSVLDPACGSGRLLLAMAKLNRGVLLYGADFDLICCKMTLLNMLLNSLKGEIAHMDTLSNNFFRGFKVQTKLIDGYYYPFFKEFFNAEESLIYTSSPLEKSMEAIEQETPKNRILIKQGELFADF